MRELVYIASASIDQDLELVKELYDKLMPLAAARQITVVTRSTLLPGQNHHEALHRNAAEARVALVCLSPDFLLDRFLCEEQLPMLRRREQEQALILIPALFRDCLWETHPQLQPFRRGPIFFQDKSLRTRPAALREEALVELARAIAAQMAAPVPDRVIEGPTIADFLKEAQAIRASLLQSQTSTKQLKSAISSLGIPYFVPHGLRTFARGTTRFVGDLALSSQREDIIKQIHDLIDRCTESVRKRSSQEEMFPRRSSIERTISHMNDIKIENNEPIVKINRLIKLIDKLDIY